MFTSPLTQYILTQNTIKHFLHKILEYKYAGMKIRIQTEKILTQLRLLKNLFLEDDGKNQMSMALDSWI